MEMDVDDSLTINKTYAERYEKKKRKEELSKLQDIYGPNAEWSEESSSSEEEDEAAQGVTPHRTKEFLRVLSLVKHRDAKIYDEDYDFYHEESSNGSDSADSGKISKNRPMFLKDYEREQLLEKGSLAGLSDEDDEDRKDGQPLPYVKEQQQLKNRFKQALCDAMGDESGDELLSLRQKTDQEKEEEEAEYIKWLKGHELKIKEQEMQDMDALRRYWTDPQLNSDEAFLRDYVLNEGWKDKAVGRIPSYDEVVGEGPDVSDDEEYIEEQDDFERQYNFRFEEPGSAQIVSYPRTVSGSVRLEDERRKQRRKAREERKEKEREQKKEELRRLKNLKRQEIQEKLQKIQELTGNTVVGFTAEELEDDFDPDSYDAGMSRIFDEQYYEKGGDAEKPVFSDSEEEEFVENLDDWVAEEEPHCEDPNFNMDADYDPDATLEVTPRNQRRQKRKSHFSHVVHRQKPLFEPSEKPFEEYFDEYYKLDYEDLVADIPCRFKYRQTLPNDFGLSTEEILISDNTELNRWASLMKTVQFRSEDEEKKDVSMYRKKAKNVQNKLRVLSTLKDLLEKEEEDVADDSDSKRARKRKRSFAREATLTGSVYQTERKSKTADVVVKREKPSDTSEERKKRGKRRKVPAEESTPTVSTDRRKNADDRSRAKDVTGFPQGLSSSRLASYGLITEKKRRRKGV